MNAKLWACVIVAVLVAHLALLLIIDNWRRLNAPPLPAPPEPSFAVTTYRYVDEAGRELKVERHYKVSTKLADEETMKALPPPPVEN